MSATLFDTPPKPKAKNYDVLCLSTTVSPLTHMAGVEGNEAVVMREPVATADGRRFVPVISGNAIRHRMIRAPGVRFLCDRWGLAGTLTLAQLNFLFHGGNLTQSSNRVSIARMDRLYDCFPLLRLLGCSLPDQIVAGALYAHRGMLVCRENRSRLSQSVPSDWSIDFGSLPSAESLIEPYQYTRGDGKVSAAGLLPPEGDDEAGSNMMIFAGQSVISGARFLHGFHLRHVGPLELGALLLSLRLWNADGGTIGGQSARGHGKLSMAIHVAGDADEESLVASYVDHVDAKRKDGPAFLAEIFTPTEDKPKRGKKKATTDDDAA